MDEEKPIPVPMTAPATLYEKIEMAYKVNCKTIDDICKSEDATNIDIVIDPKTNRVNEIKKCKVGKSAITSVPKACSFVPFPQNSLIAPRNLAESSTLNETHAFDQIVEINTRLMDQARDCDQTLKGEFCEKCMKAIHENICALQPPLQEYHGALYAFDPNQAIPEIQSMFNQLGQNYSVKFMANEKKEVSAPEKGHNTRFIWANGICDLCKFDRGERLWIHYCCKKFICNSCECKCRPNAIEEIGKTCEKRDCGRCSDWACFTCKIMVCEIHRCN